MATRAPAGRIQAQGLAGLVRAIPAWAWLTGLVLVSTGVRYLIARRSVAPWIMVDELIYSELAKSFASTGHFLVRDQATAAYGIVYPILLAPAWALFKAVPDAYAAARAINALVMSLAAVPAYFIARRVLSSPLSLAAAALAVSVPSMLYTGTLMTENAFYPIFLAVVLAIVAWLERPTPALTAAVLALAGLAFLTRAQSLALVPAIVTAPIALAWAGRRGWRSLRDYRLMYGAVGGAAVVAVVVQVARGRSPLGLLGAYEVAGRSHYRAWEVFRWWWYHVAELDLSLGVVPFAALILLVATARGLDRRAQAFLAAAVCVSFWLVLEVAVFASEQAGRVEERNMFYVAPLFLTALLVWIDRGAPRPGAAAAAAALAAGALPGVLPYQSLITLNAVSDTPAILPLWALHSRFFAIDQVALVAVLSCIAAAVLFVLVPRRYALVLPALVLAYFAVSQKPIEDKHLNASVGALFAGITDPERDWVDRAVGRNARVAVLWSGNTDSRVIWENEFFNRSLGRVYELGAPLGGGLPAQHVEIDVRSGVLSADGRPISTRYLLTDRSVGIVGRPVASDPPRAMVVYRIDGPLRQTWSVTGLYPDDTWSGPTVTYRRVGCTGGSLTVLLRGDPSLFTRPQTVVARSGERVVGSILLPPAEPRRLRVPLTASGGTCEVVFTVTPTAVPAVVTKGANTDTRLLGVHFNAFRFEP